MKRCQLDGVGAFSLRDTSTGLESDVWTQIQNLSQIRIAMRLVNAT
jgi:hypothetical protein